MKFAFIHEHRDQFAVVKMCSVLGVSTSGYGAWRARLNRPETKREAYRKELRQKICKSFHESQGTYGSPRVHDDLVEWGYQVSPKTVARLMKEMDLKATPEEMYVVTTDSNHDLEVFPNLLKRNFTATQPDRVWVADITYVRTLEGWMYLATVLDLFSRKIVGWSIDKHMKTDLTISALKMAYSSRHVSEGLIHHSDRGSQYCSAEYRALLDAKGCQGSMSRKGDPYDNACIESFHATIKKELIYRRRFQTRAEAAKAINYYISNHYNTKRKHSTLAYLSPMKFEQKYYLENIKKAS